MHELGWRSKAIVVTSSRLASVKSKLAFNRYIEGEGSTSSRSLMAFSGKVEGPADRGSAYKEVSMNHWLAESELPETFSRLIETSIPACRRSSLTRTATCNASTQPCGASRPTRGQLAAKEPPGSCLTPRQPRFFVGALL
jgi:hypothetical protein